MPCGKVRLGLPPQRPAVGNAAGMDTTTTVLYNPVLNRGGWTKCIGMRSLKRSGGTGTLTSGSTTTIWTKSSPISSAARRLTPRRSSIDERSEPQNPTDKRKGRASAKWRILQERTSPPRRSTRSSKAPTSVSSRPGSDCCVTARRAERQGLCRRNLDTRRAVGHFQADMKERQNVGSTGPASGGRTMTETPPGDGRKHGEDSPEVRLLLRLFLGFFGGLFIAVVSYLVLWYSFDPRLPTEAPAALASLFGFLLGAPVVAFAAFARNRWIRVGAWAAGGAGFGDVLLAIIAGGLEVGTVLTPVGVIMAVVGSILGYRTVPPIRSR